MYILYPADFTLGYYKTIKDLQFKLKAIKRLKEFKKKLKDRRTENALPDNEGAYC